MRRVIAFVGLLALGCSDEDSAGGGGTGGSFTGGTGGVATGGTGGTAQSGGTGNGTSTGGAGGLAGSGATSGTGGAQPATYPFQGYTKTRGALEAIVDGATKPRILIVDRLTKSTGDGDETSGRGSLPWALARGFPRVILFEISGVIDVGGSLPVTSPYVSVHGQTAPEPGITLYNVELFLSTHDVILQHLRVRMGGTEIGGGDSITICGASGDSVHDIIIDHCSPALGHDEQLSISACDKGDVRRVTLSNNLISFGGNPKHNFGTLIDSGSNNNYDVDEILVEGNLFSQLSFRTPMVNWAARHVTVTNNVTYNADWTGMHFATAQYPEGQFIDVLNNLYWRGPRTQTVGQWPTDEVSTWPAQPDLWPTAWGTSRRPVSDFAGPSGNNLHVYFAGNYDYVNAEDYTFGNHEGRPVRLEHQRYYSGEVQAADVTETSRQTNVVVKLLSPAELESHVKDAVGSTPGARDAVDALAVSQAFARTGGYIQSIADLGVPPVPTGSNERTLTAIGGYPAGTELDDPDGNGLTNLEEWVYGL